MNKKQQMEMLKRSYYDIAEGVYGKNTKKKIKQLEEIKTVVQELIDMYKSELEIFN